MNSDDPALFDTTLNDEVLTLAVPFGLDVAAIDEILLTINLKTAKALGLTIPPPLLLRADR